MDIHYCDLVKTLKLAKKKRKRKKYWKGPKHKAKLYVLTLRLEFIFSTFITEVKIKLNSIFNYSILSTQPLT